MLPQLWDRMEMILAGKVPAKGVRDVEVITRIAAKFAPRKKQKKG